MQFHKKTDINGHELLFDQLQICGSEVPTLLGVLSERLSAQPLSGLLQLPEAGARCLPAGLPVPPTAPPEPPPAASGAAVHAMPSPGTARLGGDVSPGSRPPLNRTTRHPCPGAQPPLRLGDTQPASARVFLRPNAQQPQHFVPYWHSEGPRRVPVDEKSPCKHR